MQKRHGYQNAIAERTALSMTLLRASKKGLKIKKRTTGATENKNFSDKLTHTHTHTHTYTHTHAHTHAHTACK